jgi:hypothetical protein
VITFLPPEEPPPTVDGLAEENRAQERLRQRIAELHAATVALEALQLAVIAFIGVLEAAKVDSPPASRASE